MAPHFTKECANYLRGGTDTHMRLGPGDPRLQKERQARLVEPPGGLHGDEDVLQLQLPLGDARAFSGPASRVLLRAPGHGWSRLDAGAAERAGCELERAADAQLKIHVEDDEEGEDQDGQTPADPSLTHGRSKSLRGASKS